MKVSDILASSEEMQISLEVYPPKTTHTPGGQPIQQHISSIFETIDRLMRFNPAFVSVTYNPEGQTRATSIPIAAILKQRFKVETVAHLTCIATSPEELDRTLDVIEFFGINNILALRGDRPQGKELIAGGLEHASDLVSAIKAHSHDFCIGVAGYPEGHPECTGPGGERDLGQDLVNFKTKVDQGANFAISQLFFDNASFFDYVERVWEMGLKIPIIPGIMPIISHDTVTIVQKLCGATVPNSLEQKIKTSWDEPEEIMAIGIEQATKQCRELADKVPCIHFYTMDKWEAVEQIIEGFM